eukprot:m.24532 g.24532  ORF g.24532 m.24532 type:complete len:475 (+) comp4166_c0_seq2:272-1696(+)
MIPMATPGQRRESLVPAVGIRTRARASGTPLGGSAKKSKWSFPVEQKDIRRGDDGSLGMSIKTRDGTCGQLTVHSVQPFGPAQMVGIRRGHVIVAIDGQDIIGYSHKAALERLAQLSDSPIVPVTVCLSSAFVKYKRANPDDDVVSTPNSTEGSPDTKGPAQAARRLDYSPVTPGGRKDQYVPLQVPDDIPSGDTDDNPYKQQAEDLLSFLAHLRDNKGLTSTGRRMLEEYGFAPLLDSLPRSPLVNSVGPTTDDSTTQPEPSFRDLVIGELTASTTAPPAPPVAVHVAAQKPPRKSTVKTGTTPKATRSSTGSRLSDATESFRQKIVVPKHREVVHAPAAPRYTPFYEKEGSREVAARSVAGSKIARSRKSSGTPRRKKRTSNLAPQSDRATTWNFEQPDDDTASLGMAGNTRASSDAGSDFSFVNLARMEPVDLLEYSYSGSMQFDTMSANLDTTSMATDGMSFRSRATSFI